MKCNPVTMQTERSLMLRDRMLCMAAICASTPFPFVESGEEEEHIRRLVRELSEAGLSPSGIASYIRDATDRICLFVSRLPVAQRGVSWFCKETLHRLRLDIQIPNNLRFSCCIQNREEE